MEDQNQSQQKRGLVARHKSKLFGIVIAFGLVILAISGDRIWETNEAGYFQVKQAFYSGDMTVRFAPGTYNQNLGTVTTYEKAGAITMSASADDNADYGPVRVQFANGFADIDLSIVYQLKNDEKPMIDLHIDYNTNNGIREMVKTQVQEAVLNTATLMSAEEAYNSRRAEFVNLARKQALAGLFEALVEEDTITTQSGQRQIRKTYGVKKKDGEPIVTKEALLIRYGIDLTQFNIKNMKFDDKLTALIESRKDAQKATQDAITEKSLGDTRIAREKATQEVEKIKAVTIAEKNKEVAELVAEQAFRVAELGAKEAKEKAKKIIAEGKAEAETNRLKVNAGLTPQEKAYWAYRSDSITSANLSKVVLPDMMIFGGGGNSPTNPFDAIGLESYMKIQDKMATNKAKK